jgi:transcriptional regulator with XRE-family HTH domain
VSITLRDYLWINRAKITSSQLAERLGISRSYLSKIANGRLCPSIDLAKAIQMETNGEVLWYEVMEFSYNYSQRAKKAATGKKK